MNPAWVLPDDTIVDLVWTEVMLVSANDVERVEFLRTPEEFLALPPDVQEKAKDFQKLIKLHEEAASVEDTVEAVPPGGENDRS